MSQFLLVGTRDAGPGELSPVIAARDLMALAAGWERLAGYDVIVLPLIEAVASRRSGR